jgi:hypothetical protein
MKNVEGLKLTIRGGREFTMTRDYNAPCSLFFEDFTKPDLVMLLLIGPPDWSCRSAKLILEWAELIAT